MGRKSDYRFMVRGAGLIKFIFNILLIVLAAVVFNVLFYHGRDCERIVASHELVKPEETKDSELVKQKETMDSELVKPEETKDSELVKQKETMDSELVKQKETKDSLLLLGCDLFSGKWVYDNESYPLYRDRDCKFMFDDLACEKYGRKDLEYQHWRWQPHGCDLPRFNATMFLEKLRGKRLVFVGDSLNRNQWVSIVCMVESSIPKEFKYMRLNGSLYSFKATEYNASIDFYWSPLLVESNADDPSNHRVLDRIVRIKSIEKHAKNWGDADVIVFNSYQWWRMPTLKLLRGTFEGHDHVYKDVQSLRLYRMALKTWSNWLIGHLDSKKTRLFFVSMAATHSRAEEWGMPKNQNCLNETEPILRDGFWGSNSDPKMMRATDRALSKLKGQNVNIQMINITQLSEYRKDGHPSVYKKQYHPLSKEQLSDPRNYADCTHWCLPGVPDVWNEILYAHLLYL